jgi:S1-C subfamily serine protease
VYTVGHPGFGKETLDLTPSEGILASARRELEGAVFVQASMNVNPGNSGGPMVTGGGEVVGVVVRKGYLDGVCFAVPASELADAMACPSSLHAPPSPKK